MLIRACLFYCCGCFSFRNIACVSVSASASVSVSSSVLRIFCFAQDNVTVSRATERDRERERKVERERGRENPATVAAYGLPLQLPLRFADDLFISTMMTLLRSDDWQLSEGRRGKWGKGCAWADAEINDVHANVFVGNNSP